jgi:gamma-glutamyl:cysteine ligase YbdK (ATP-grasp superfamily)
MKMNKYFQFVRWTERSEQVSSPSTRNPPSSAVDENRDSSARRGLDSSVIEREVIDTRNREIIEKAAKDIATVDPNAQTTRSREIIEKAATDIATVDPIVQITESVDVGDGNDDDDDLWA